MTRRMHPSTGHWQRCVSLGVGQPMSRMPPARHHSGAIETPSAGLATGSAFERVPTFVGTARGVVWALCAAGPIR